MMRSTVPCRPGHEFDHDHQLRRQAYLRRQLFEVAALILAGLEAGDPVGEVAWRADCALSPAITEVMVVALGDEQP